MFNWIYYIIKKLMWNNYEVPNACMDMPDERDRHYEDVVWYNRHISEQDILLGNSVARQNQSLPNNPSTKMACWSYWIAHCNNVTRERNTTIPYVHGNVLWARFVMEYSEIYRTQHWIDPIVHWSYLQDQLKFAIAQWIIEWYAVVNKSKNAIDNSLYNWHTIYTGSSRIDWRATRNNNARVVPWPWAGHAFMIDGKKWEYYRCRDSSWPNNMDNWRFWIKNDQLHLLFTVYSVFWLKDKPIIDNFLKKIEEAKANVQAWKSPSNILEQIAYNNRERL